ncbi:MAG: MotA/TolQ/ExbB proton channel family protein [Kiritimatiellae bacterium]|nr:MotA/TolQ/ExbB proton channel family protein [Kiritimatiellia bacterium]
MRKRLVFGIVLVVMGIALFGVCQALAQEKVEVAEGLEAPEGAVKDSAAPTFFQVVASGGFFGVLLWLSLLACSIAGMALIVDSFITIRGKKIIPDTLVAQVREAMEEGDVMKAMKNCEEEPGPMANILLAGFSNVEEGFDVIQDAIGAAADLESEKLLQRVTYLSVVGSLSPMLGLLGTVQGMILAFGTLALEQAGVARQAMLALNISQALYTTAAGLCIAVPALAFYYFFRNRANKVILNMEMITLDLIKALRNVEVVEE